MPDGAGFFSATRASNRFDVDGWNICKRRSPHRRKGPVLPGLSNWRAAPQGKKVPSDNFAIAIVLRVPTPHVVKHRQASGLLCELPKKRRRTEVSASAQLAAWCHRQAQ